MNFSAHFRFSQRMYYCAALVLALGIITLFCATGSTATTAYLREHNRYRNMLGIFVILGLCTAISHNRAAINIKLVMVGMLMHVSLAFAMLKTHIGQAVIGSVAGLVSNLYAYAGEGISFVFGSLGLIQDPWGFIFAFRVLPIIIFFGAFMSLLFHLGVIQRIVNVCAYFVQPLLGTSGPETVCAIANSFLGQTEAPLLIRHYLSTMTKSEFLVVMVSGMGTISGGILAVFAAMGVPVKHLLASSIMAIPATIVIAKLLYPETEKQSTLTYTTPDAVENKQESKSILDAISQGTSDGLQLALNVGAMLIAFLALIGMANSLLSWSCVQLQFLVAYTGASTTIPMLTLQKILGLLCLPFGWLLGFTGIQAQQVSQLLGTKVAVNELVAYGNMITMHLPERAVILSTYALCGFSNFSCIGIQIGGIGALVPEKRAWLSQLGLRAVLGGALANLLSACVAGLLL